VRERAIAATSRAPAIKRSASAKNDTVAGVHLTHPDRVYWDDAGVTKRDLAEYYVKVWKWMRPHVTGRPISLLRCPEGASGQCFFQKHTRAGIPVEHLHRPGTRYSVDNLAALLPPCGRCPEIHTRATIDDRERDRLVFDLDPVRPLDDGGSRTRCSHPLSKLVKSYLKTSGARACTSFYNQANALNEAKTFAQNIAASMAADSRALHCNRHWPLKRIFIDIYATAGKQRRSHLSARASRTRAAQLGGRSWHQKRQPYTVLNPRAVTPAQRSWTGITRSNKRCQSDAGLK
jgi:bifunctional non-homologous end joining protein LigD